MAQLAPLRAHSGGYPRHPHRSGAGPGAGRPDATPSRRTTRRRRRCFAPPLKPPRSRRRRTSPPATETPTPGPTAIPDVVARARDQTRISDLYTIGVAAGPVQERQGRIPLDRRKYPIGVRLRGPRRALQDEGLPRPDTERPGRRPGYQRLLVRVRREDVHADRAASIRRPTARRRSASRASTTTRRRRTSTA